MRMLFLFAAAATLAAPALAQDDMTTVTAHQGRTILVSVGDLDLASAAGRHERDVRLWRAARDVCSMTRLRDLSEYRAEGRCRADTLARANGQRAAQQAD